MFYYHQLPTKSYMIFIIYPNLQKNSGSPYEESIYGVSFNGTCLLNDHIAPKTNINQETTLTSVITYVGTGMCGIQLDTPCRGWTWNETTIDDTFVEEIRWYSGWYRTSDDMILEIWTGTWNDSSIQVRITRNVVTLLIEQIPSMYLSVPETCQAKDQADGFDKTPVTQSGVFPTPGAGTGTTQAPTVNTSSTATPTSTPTATTSTSMSTSTTGMSTGLSTSGTVSTLSSGTGTNTTNSGSSTNTNISSTGSIAIPSAASTSLPFYALTLSMLILVTFL